ncbi:FG-GAP-like repeat-containing protein [Streptomyces sp. NBC_01210]|uniref:FG-GAP-like repeat-containing protein n=1 Tax=Streptomyces sp. NBC_01210 TaxID=2903774 RepID=UPI002E13A73C|nr:FG-GAP-like repeat-containing protein [Streptomyces sp. NBC_01210]
MASRAVVRATTAAAAAVSLALGIGLGPVEAQADPGEPAAAVEIPTTFRTTPRALGLLGTGTYQQADAAGAQGVFHTQEGVAGNLWTRYSDGRTFSAQRTGTGALGRTVGTGADTLAYISDSDVELRDPAAGTSQFVTVPEGLSYSGVYGNTVVAVKRETVVVDGTSTSRITEAHLLDSAEDGRTRDRLVTGLPDGGLYGGAVGGDATTVVLRVKVGDTLRLATVDAATARVTAYTASADINGVLLSPKYLGWYSLSGTIKVVPRSDITATPVELTAPAPQDRSGYEIGLVGDWVVHINSSTGRIIATPIAGGTPRTLLGKNTFRLSQAPDGTVLVVGGEDADDWALRRIGVGPDGVPVVTTVLDLPPVPAPVRGIAAGDGYLLSTDASTGLFRAQFRMLEVHGTPTQVIRRTLNGTFASCAGDDPGCAALKTLGAGRFAYVVRYPGSAGGDEIQLIDSSYTTSLHRTGTHGGSVTDAAGRYVIYTNPAVHQQLVIDVTGQQPVLTRTASAAAVWAGQLWSPGTTAGTVTAYDLAAKRTTETVDTGAGCVPEELQTLGRWLYWSCGASGGAGIYDRTAKKSIAVAADEALLGDGYLVRHDKTAGKLELTDFSGGTAVDREVADLPATAASQRGIRWTVDKFGGHIAYADAAERMHVVPTGVATQPLSVSEVSKTVTGDGSNGGEWQFSGVLSKPANSVTLVVKDKTTGAVIRTMHGNEEVRGHLERSWDGRSDSGSLMPDGAYTWTLTAQPADGHGAPLTLTGLFTQTHGAPARRDFSHPRDGVGDLVALDRDDAMRFHFGNGAGGFRSGGFMYWYNVTQAVPLGDMNGDRCNDLIVRETDGHLSRINGRCTSSGGPLDDSAQGLGGGWNQFNVLTSPGDLTGDGRPDLVARQASTGDLYLYADNGSGGLKARGRIGAKWTAYRAVFGAGDLNGDGIGDLLAVDKANSLWRYDGTATGALKPRVLVFGNNWGLGQNAFVGVGDITKDGKPDLISRNAAGHLLRNNGNGKGSFGSTVKIGTGWQGYKGLF